MDILKDYIINQEFSEKEKSIKTKIFNFFYFLMNVKSYTSYITLYILHTIEIIQLISFAFSQPLILNWNMPENIYIIVEYIIEGTRLVPILRRSTYRNFLLVFCIFFVIVMILFISLLLQILYLNETSKLCMKTLSLTRLLMPFLTIFLFLPITELFLVPFKCENNLMFDEEVQCWKNVHFLFVIFGIIGEITFLAYIYLLNYFYFYPFPLGKSTIKLNPDTDLLLIKIKIAFEIQFLYIKNQYICIVILLILSLYLVFYNLNRKTYIPLGLELFINLRNILVFWTFFMLLISKLCLKSDFNNNIILLVLCYPIIIFGFVLYYIRNNDQIGFFYFSNNDNINTCLIQIKVLIKLITSFIEEKKSGFKNYETSSNQKNEIVLKGIIEIHTKNCLKEECPLTKFIQNEGNYITQKQCLLNYMTIFFNNAIRKYPNDILIKMHYIQFNFDQKYNLSSVKSTFEDIKKLKFKVQSQFILYIQEKHITRMQLNEVNEGNEEEKEKLILEQNYKRLKNYISNATKLYAEFWGIFATNLTNNLNTFKLYKLGEKLNEYLKEIFSLWKNDLRNKKINFENQNIAQLYCIFLREILWDKKKSDDVQKKINDEQYLQEFNKIKNEQKINMNNIDSLENQDFIIFVSSNERGKCNIIQFSNSLSFIIGYQKHELINKPLETLMPSILTEGHSQKVENFIKTINNIKNIDRDNFNESMKKSINILIKSKMGYLIPFTSKFTLYDDNDFSNSFIIKAKLESIDTKSMYPYYLLTKPDFSLDSFSSSAIHLGFSMDLLKKYVINLNLLIRTAKDQALDLNEKYQMYETHERVITWVFPDLIYPKNDIAKGKNKDKEISIQELISNSKKQRLYLQMFEMKYKENEVSGFVFKLYESKTLKPKKKEFSLKEFIPDNKTQINFDLLNLNFIRTVVVKKKSGFRNLRRIDEENQKINYKNTIEAKKSKRKYEVLKEKEDSSDNEIVEVKITKEKLFELQTKDSFSIKSFINMLPFYGSEISLIKHRPNKERYPVGKAQEPSIKIVMSNFTKRIEARIKDNPNFYKKLKDARKEAKISVNDDNSKKEESGVSNEIKKEENKNEGISEEIDKELSGSSSFSLDNVINIKSLNIIKYIDYLIHIFVLVILVLEFIFTYNFFSDHIQRYTYFISSFKMLNDLTYVKYYLTEGILDTELNYYIGNILKMNHPKEKTYIEHIQNCIKGYLLDVNDILSEFNTPKVEFSKEYNDYVTNTIITIKTINNNEPVTESHPYISAETKLTNALYQVGNSINGINHKDKYVYELMINLLNSYYINYEKIIQIMIRDFNEKTNNSGIKNIVIFSVAIFVSIIYLIIFHKLMLQLNIDREKSINLFLTIKNSVFEDLKNSAENFSNKLLNKSFGVDENEEESQNNFQANIKPKDINIAKFKALNEYGIKNNNQGNSFMFYFVQLIIFHGVILIVLLLKYINTILYYSNIKEFIKVYNTTYFSEIYMISTVDMIKQYFYNKSIVNYGFTEETQIYNFLIGFIRLADHISYAVEETSKTDCFLKGNYLNSFKKYYYSDFTELINGKGAKSNPYMRVSFKTINLELIEELKYLCINYFMNDRKNVTNLNSSDLINDQRWIFVDNILSSFYGPWYNNMIKLIDQSFYDYAYDKQSSNLLLFILMIIIISLYFWIIWKSYEDDFIKSIERSFDLINLIPEEIKNIIAGKLNESS